MFGFLAGKTDLNTLDDKTPLETSEETMTEEKKLETKIFALYRLAFLGIYRVNDNAGPSHLNRLSELFIGAGMSTFIHKLTENSQLHENHHRTKLGMVRVLLPLEIALNDFGLGKLKLFDGISVASLEAVIEILEAYVKEIASVDALYQILRGLQVGLRMPTEDDERAVMDQFVPAADQFARRILHLDARLDVLVSLLEDEFWNQYGAVDGRQGWPVQDLLYPPGRGRSRKGFSSFS
ncbi:hypothetical protein N7457_002785 [Penicillium paradoxum]|uniref:uncharacterized protein n=1 Tax=Penicillium paradoxum TaxID=176176 RepID=UPI002548C65E|nr:uncharacterized protein N7457_002785 [Penicillium paradoxum]KAJ5787795.1 hypothetical protein N7457_002785 [Penicillium paradoxum]